MYHVTARCRIGVTKETEQQIHFSPDNDSKPLDYQYGRSQIRLANRLIHAMKL